MVTFIAAFVAPASERSAFKHHTCPPPQSEVFSAISCAVDFVCRGSALVTPPAHNHNGFGEHGPRAQA